MKELELELFKSILGWKGLIDLLHHGKNFVHTALDLSQIVRHVVHMLELLTVASILALLLDKILHEQINHQVQLEQKNK